MRGRVNREQLVRTNDPAFSPRFMPTTRFLLIQGLTAGLLHGGELARVLGLSRFAPPFELLLLCRCALWGRPKHRRMRPSKHRLMYEQLRCYSHDLLVKSQGSRTEIPCHLLRALYKVV